jgi:L-ascorbate metabolism protein UlaG (beta-lactamase superfamily)
MKRRQLIGCAGFGLVTALATNLDSHYFASAAQSSGLSVQWLGHTCFLFTGGGVKILVNPFRPIGCTAGYRAPKVAADLVLISSQLLDEGDVTGLPGNPKLVYEAGNYEFKGIKFQGITTDHDRKGGKQFGANTVWRWKQGGIDILDLGGVAAPISVEQKILLANPDVLLIPVGGSDKAYNAQEAKEAIALLNPKIVIPTHYKTQAADPNPTACGISPIDDFLNLISGVTVHKNSGDSFTISSKQLPKNTIIEILNYKFSA